VKLALVISNVAIISQALTLKEAFETAAQLNEGAKWMEFDRAFCKIFKLMLDRFLSFFRKKWKIGRENEP